MSNAKGGLPIKAGDQLIRAVSVSGGGGGDGDVACASAGLAKVADKLVRADEDVQPNRGVIIEAPGIGSLMPAGMEGLR